MAASICSVMWHTLAYGMKLSGCFLLSADIELPSSCMASTCSFLSGIVYKP